MSEVLAAFRRSFHSLLRTPGFSLGAVLTLALGTAGAITFFGAFHATLLKAPPYPQAHRIYQVALRRPSRLMTNVSAIPVREMAAACPGVEAVGVYTNDWSSSEMETDGVRLRVPTVWVDAGAMELLGNGVALGTPLQAGHHARGEGVLLSHAFWKERFGGDPAILGRSLPLGGGAQTVVGILRPGFELPFFPGACFIRPLGPLGANRRGEFRFTAMVRLREGFAPRQAEGVFRGVQEEQLRQFPRNTIAEAIPVLIPLKTATARSVPGVFLLVCGAAGLLLLLAAANVAALFLNRAAARSGDTAVRLCLGASRWQVLRESLPEGLIVSAAASCLGLIVAIQAGRAIRIWMPSAETLPGVNDAWTHPAVTLFTLALVLLLGGILGAMQVFQVQEMALESALRGSGSQGRSTHRVREGLVVGQLALATTLVFAAFLMGRSLYRLMVQPAGFPTRGLQVVDLEPLNVKWTGGNMDPGRLLRHLEARPGIRKAAMARAIPSAWEEDEVQFAGGLSLQNGSECSANASTDFATLQDSRQTLNFDFVSEGYAETLGLRILQGRTFSPEEAREGRKVCVLDELAARQCFPDGAVGRKCHLGVATAKLAMGEPLEVVGVVSSFRELSPKKPAEPFILLPATLSPPLRILIRSQVGGPALRQEVAKALEAELPELRIRKVQDVEGFHWEQERSRRRFLGLLLAFTGLALLMAALGLGALIASQVAQRTREMGIRAAIGATPAMQLESVLGNAFLRSLGGIGLGLGISLSGARILRGMLYGVGEADPLSLAGACGALLAATLLAALAPALRAARIHPAQALRMD